jgi:hypothetical protein
MRHDGDALSKRHHGAVLIVDLCVGMESAAGGNIPAPSINNGHSLEKLLLR